jgi:hypothetical protein
MEGDCHKSHDEGLSTDGLSLNVAVFHLDCATSKESGGTDMKRVRIGIWLVSALIGVVAPSVSMAQIISITIAPPVLPVYVQPPIPEPGYL